VAASLVNDFLVVRWCCFARCRSRDAPGERERCGVCAVGVEGRSGPAGEQEEGSGVQWDMSSEGEKE
jgi:hypothetical protein